MHHLTPKELADRWQIGVQTLANMRSRGDGPAWIKCGRLVRYRLEDVIAHENAHMQGRNAA
ncbi:helix-turn-helix transcriptional regulator [Marinitenerispora sediminis]|uniref:Helix-turn-helix domain-containing protein n=1 Tax=Marinitenerispora sediminis TaxID=1931232 RepID=A0A368T5N3_9ACTN|nr:helix-turn-helix domain-containing protein [Marinitenerispora sediminis]RCV50687.1 hypothetical protein DEF28_17375 [Marinitenerispora sediminis]RCV56362.1 hypothetical protein DEF23_12655 [Marinitenerispora sediminis]RCV58697.1 hypothetical protein DEF24_12485 [Marinitenerispora sediminis]